MLALKPGSTEMPSTCIFMYADLDDTIKMNIAALPTLLCKAISRCFPFSFQLDGETDPLLQAAKCHTMGTEVLTRVRELAALVTRGKYSAAPCLSCFRLILQFASESAPPPAKQARIVEWLRFAVFYHIAGELIADGVHCMRHSEAQPIYFLPRICTDGMLIASNTIVDDVPQQIHIPGVGAQVSVSSPASCHPCAAFIDAQIQINTAQLRAAASNTLVARSLGAKTVGDIELYMREQRHMFVQTQMRNHRF